jgi:hypothetical protein
MQRIYFLSEQGTRMSPFCPYRDIFGKVKTGVHQYRIFNIAVVDVLGTILIAFLISRQHFWYVLIALFILGIILHRLFCVRTTIDKLLFPSIK